MFALGHWKSACISHYTYANLEAKLALKHFNYELSRFGVQHVKFSPDKPKLNSRLETAYRRAHSLSDATLTLNSLENAVSGGSADLKTKLEYFALQISLIESVKYEDWKGLDFFSDLEEYQRTHDPARDTTGKLKNPSTTSKRIDAQVLISIKPNWAFCFKSARDPKLALLDHVLIKLYKRILVERSGLDETDYNLLTWALTFTATAQWAIDIVQKFNPRNPHFSLLALNAILLVTNAESLDKKEHNLFLTQTKQKLAELASNPRRALSRTLDYIFEANILSNQALSADDDEQGNFTYSFYRSRFDLNHAGQYAVRLIAVQRYFTYDRADDDFAGELPQLIEKKFTLAETSPLAGENYKEYMLYHAETGINVDPIMWEINNLHNNSKPLAELKKTIETDAASLASLEVTDTERNAGVYAFGQFKYKARFLQLKDGEFYLLPDSIYHPTVLIPLASIIQFYIDGCGTFIFSGEKNQPVTWENRKLLYRCRLVALLQSDSTEDEEVGGAYKKYKVSLEDGVNDAGTLNEFLPRRVSPTFGNAERRTVQEDFNLRTALNKFESSHFINVQVDTGTGKHTATVSLTATCGDIIKNTLQSPGVHALLQTKASIDSPVQKDYYCLSSGLTRFNSELQYCRHIIDRNITLTSKIKRESENTTKLVLAKNAPKYNEAQTKLKMNEPKSKALEENIADAKLALRKYIERLGSNPRHADILLNEVATEGFNIERHSIQYARDIKEKEYTELDVDGFWTNEGTAKQLSPLWPRMFAECPLEQGTDEIGNKDKVICYRETKYMFCPNQNVPFGINLTTIKDVTYITDIVKDGWAYVCGLRAGNVIETVNGEGIEEDLNNYFQTDNYYEVLLRDVLHDTIDDTQSRMFSVDNGAVLYDEDYLVITIDNIVISEGVTESSEALQTRLITAHKGHGFTYIPLGYDPTSVRTPKYALKDFKDSQAQFKFLNKIGIIPELPEALEDLEAAVQAKNKPIERRYRSIGRTESSIQACFKWHCDQLISTDLFEFEGAVTLSYLGMAWLSAFYERATGFDIGQGFTSGPFWQMVQSHKLCNPKVTVNFEFLKLAEGSGLSPITQWQAFIAICQCLLNTNYESQTFYDIPETVRGLFAKKYTEGDGTFFYTNINKCTKVTGEQLLGSGMFNTNSMKAKLIALIKSITNPGTSSGVLKKAGSLAKSAWNLSRWGTSTKVNTKPTKRLLKELETEIASIGGTGPIDKAYYRVKDASEILKTITKIVGQIISNKEEAQTSFADM